MKNQIILKRGTRVLTPDGAGELTGYKDEKVTENGKIVRYQVKIYPKGPNDWTMKYWYTRKEFVVGGSNDRSVSKIG